MWVGLFVDLETGGAGGEVFDDLAGGGETGVDVGFAGLCPHLLGGGEDAGAEFFAEGGVVVRSDVGDVFEVFTFGEGLFKSFFVNDFLAGGVDESGASW